MQINYPLKTRTMNIVNPLNFAGQTIDVELDLHKTSWRINARMDDREIACFSQNPDTPLLKKYFDRNYPAAKIRVVYEAGFCRFGIQKYLKELGIECIVAVSFVPPLFNTNLYLEKSFSRF